VNDFVIDVERGAKKVEGAFEAIDGHVDAGAKAARVGENDFHAGRSSEDEGIVGEPIAKAKLARPPIGASTGRADAPALLVGHLGDTDELLLPSSLTVPTTLPFLAPVQMSSWNLVWDVLSNR